MPTAILKEALAVVGGTGFEIPPSLLFVARRDPVLLKAAQDSGFQRSLSRSIKEFPIKEAVA